MNKINLCEILKNVPKGTELYSPIAGEVKFDGLDDIYGSLFPIDLETKNGKRFSLTKEGCYFTDEDSECLLWPSKKVRTWERFKTNKSKFNPLTLKPFDKVLCRLTHTDKWHCNLFSHAYTPMEEVDYPFVCMGVTYKHVIPYNNETKHLIGTIDKVPEYYRYWKD